MGKEKIFNHSRRRRKYFYTRYRTDAVRPHGQIPDPLHQVL